MSILIEHYSAEAPVPSTLPIFGGAGSEWRSPIRGSIVALDAADAFAALLHHRIMAEAARIERAVRDAALGENGVQNVLICTDTRNRDIATPVAPVN